jgi:hypothetical protein
LNICWNSTWVGLSIVFSVTCGARGCRWKKAMMVAPACSLKASDLSGRGSSKADVPGSGASRDEAPCEGVMID